jgi:putative ABC transport system permease protein
MTLKTISAQFSDKIWSPVITGIFHYDYFKFDERYIVVDFERLRRLLVMGEGTQQLVVFADDEKLSGGISAQIENLLGKDNVVNDWRDNYWVAVMETAKPAYTLIFMVFLVVASFLIINTVVMIIHERIKEIGMMGCLGMTRREIVTVFFFESLFLAGIGAFVGVFIGSIIVLVGSHYPLRIMELYGDSFSDMPMGNAIFFQFDLLQLFQAWLMGVAVASVFTLIPSLKSAFVEPVEALRR